MAPPCSRVRLYAYSTIIHIAITDEDETCGAYVVTENSAVGVHYS